MIDWRLDTRNKKPKVYNVAILTAVLLVLLTIVFLLQKAWMVRFSCLLLALYFLVFAALLLRGFFWQIRYDLYSYNNHLLRFFAVFAVFALPCAGNFQSVADSARGLSSGESAWPRAGLCQSAAG